MQRIPLTGNRGSIGFEHNITCYYYSTITIWDTPAHYRHNHHLQWRSQSVHILYIYKYITIYYICVCVCATETVSLAHNSITAVERVYWLWKLFFNVYNTKYYFLRQPWKIICASRRRQTNRSERRSRKTPQHIRTPRN